MYTVILKQYKFEPIDGAGLCQLVRMFKLTDKASPSPYSSCSLANKTKKKCFEFWSSLAIFQGKSIKVKFLQCKNNSISKHWKCNINILNKLFFIDSVSYIHKIIFNKTERLIST